MYSRNTDVRLPSRRQPASHLQSLDWHGSIIFVTASALVRRDYFCTAEVAAVFHRVWSDPSRWRVGEYVIMPDHVHLFARPCCPGEYGLRDWITWWKRAIAREFGIPVWQPSVWDVRMRSAEQYAEKREYVRKNPFRAGLVRIPDEWPYRGKIHDLVWRDLSQ